MSNLIEFLPHIIGGFGVLAFMISYLHHARKGILAFGILARILFVIQYIMLYAYEGAVMNSIGIICAIFGENREKQFFRGKEKYIFFLVWIMTVAAGVSVWKGIISILPIIAMLLQNSALFMKKPKTIRIFSLAGLPFWMAYNYFSEAYSGIICDVLSMISVIITMVTYDFKKDKE